MNRLEQRGRGVWGSAQVKDMAEYAAMLAIILLLVFATVKLIGKHRSHSSVSPAPSSLTR